MPSTADKPSRCTLCSLPIEPGPLLEHYRGDKTLFAYIRKVNPKFTGVVDVCAKCLEHYQQKRDGEISGLQQEQELSSEQTVITAHEGGLPLLQEEETPCLLVIHGSNFGKKYDLIKEEHILGRSETADVFINDENVSRRHAKVVIRDKKVIIEDLESTNGTFVNTKKVPSKELRDGDLVLIGNTILKFITGSNVEALYHQEIYKLATLDGLTQVSNKAHLIEKLREEFSRSRRYKRDLSIIMFDFDHFKQINDQHGHQAGDFILKRTASLIMKNLRKEDIFGRYGGEEFMIIFPETAEKSATKIAEKFRQLVEKERFTYEEHALTVSVSIGVASMSLKLDNYKQLIKSADAALYRAKREGRNRVCFASH